PHQPLASTTQLTGASSDRVLLLNLRGSLTDAESLVLTDSDHERLMEDLVKANADVLSLFRSLGRSILFIGVSPYDPAVRRLARLFLDTGRGSTQGPRYFVAPRPSAGDRAYWKDFGVKWIEEEPLRVVEALDAALRGAA